MEQKMKPLAEFKKDISNCDVINIIQINRNYLDEDILNLIKGHEAYIDSDLVVNDNIYSVNNLKESILPNLDMQTEIAGKIETLYFALFNFDYFMIIE